MKRVQVAASLVRHEHAELQRLRRLGRGRVQHAERQAGQAQRDGEHPEAEQMVASQSVAPAHAEAEHLAAAHAASWRGGTLDGMPHAERPTTIAPRHVTSSGAAPGRPVGLFEPRGAPSALLVAFGPNSGPNATRTITCAKFVSRT